MLGGRGCRHGPKNKQTHTQGKKERGGGAVCVYIYKEKEVVESCGMDDKTHREREKGRDTICEYRLQVCVETGRRDGVGLGEHRTHIMGIATSATCPPATSTLTSFIHGLNCNHHLTSTYTPTHTAPPSFSSLLRPVFPPPP